MTSRFTFLRLIDMNFRDRITGEEEKSTITFTVEEDSADADVDCG
jgi:hypothetical protein